MFGGKLTQRLLDIPGAQARLDFFLITEFFLLNVKDAQAPFGYRSDHSLIVMAFEFRNETKTRFFFSFFFLNRFSALHHWLELTEWWWKLTKQWWERTKQRWALTEWWWELTEWWWERTKRCWKLTKQWWALTEWWWELTEWWWELTEWW